MKKVIFVLGLFLVLAGVSYADLSINISESQYETQSSDTVRIRYLTAPGYSGKYWGDFKWNPSTFVFEPIAVGTETVNIVGTWNFFGADDGNAEEGPFPLTFTQTGTNAFMAPGDDGDFTATIEGMNITILNLDDNNVTTTFIGTISDDWFSMSGTQSTSDGHHHGTWRMIKVQ